MRRIGSRTDSPASMAKYVVIGEDNEEKDYNSSFVPIGIFNI